MTNNEKTVESVRIGNQRNGTTAHDKNTNKIMQNSNGDKQHDGLPSIVGKEQLLLTPIIEINMRWKNKNKEIVGGSGGGGGMVSYDNGICDSISSIRNISSLMNNTSSTNVLHQTASPAKLVRQTSTPLQESDPLKNAIGRAASKPNSFDSISTSSCHMSAIANFSSESDSSPPLRELK